MMKFKAIILISSLVAICSTSFAQNANDFYRFAEDIENEILQDTLWWKYQTGAVNYSISGNYKKALETWDRYNASTKEITEEEYAFFHLLTPINAKDYIIERAKNEQIIIINEAHHSALHRNFVSSILQGLYDNGYRYLGLEALWERSINSRLFPVLESGYYIKEPEFGNMVFEAMQIGYTLFGYEAMEGESGKNREMKQAQNIADFLSHNTEGKTLIYCGYDHVIETDINTDWGKAMAGRLKDILKIDPFTIDQVRYSEKGNEKYNHPFIKMVDKNYPIILVDSVGNILSTKQTDARIIHIQTEYKKDRPTWLAMNGIRKEYYVPKSKIEQYPVLVLAYRQDEMEYNGIPVDIIEITNKKDIKPLLLSKGEYEIVIKNRNYDEIEWYFIEIE